MESANLPTKQQSARRRENAEIDLKTYDKSLKQRGSITFWFSDEAIAVWHPPRGGKRGGQQDYSDLAIETVLTIRLIYQQPLRQTEGFVESVVKIMGLNIATPDHSTMSRRGKTINIQSINRQPGEGVCVLVDSTGLKIYGAGEWQATKHGLQKRRRWRKLHLAINESTLEILSSSLTSNQVGDSTEAVELLEQLNDDIEELIGDGAYDCQGIYVASEEREQDIQGQVIVPPRTNAGVSSENPKFQTQRDDHIIMIAQHGRSYWEDYTNYHRRLLVENAMGRYKGIIGPKLRSRSDLNQETEAKLGCKILNRMSRIGLPKAKAA